MTCLVIALSSPSGPVSSSPLARAALTSSRTAARSTSAGVSDFFAALSSGLTPTSVSVIIRPFPLNQSARWASYTVTRTVSVGCDQASSRCATGTGVRKDGIPGEGAGADGLGDGGELGRGTVDQVPVGDVQKEEGRRD